MTITLKQIIENHLNNSLEHHNRKYLALVVSFWTYPKQIITNWKYPKPSNKTFPLLMVSGDHQLRLVVYAIIWLARKVGNEGSCIPVH